MAFAVHRYRGYCDVASRSWPRVWALRLEIPVVFALFSAFYAILVYRTTYWLLQYNAYNLDDYGLYRLFSAIDNWFSLGGLFISVMGVIIWSMLLSRAVPLHYAPLLRWHPNSGILFLISIAFLLIPLVSSVALSDLFTGYPHTASGAGPYVSNYRTGAWGTLERAGGLIFGYTGLATALTMLSMWTVCLTIARIGDLQEAIWSVIALACYVVAYLVLAFQVMAAEDFNPAVAAVIYLGCSLLSLLMPNFLRDRRLRILIVYPAFLASSPGLFVLLVSTIKAYAEDRSWPYGPSLIAIYSSTVLLLSVVASVLVSSVFSWVLRRQPARLAD